MENNALKKLPHMLYADSDGRIFDHPYYRMMGFSGAIPAVIESEYLIEMPEFSKLFFMPDCPPIGLNPDTGRWEIVSQVEIDGMVIQCSAVSAFLEPGIVRAHLPAADYRGKSYILPSWAYSAVGFKDDRYWASGLRIEYNHRWDPRNFDDRELIPAISSYKKQHQSGPLVEHLMDCAAHNHCFAAKNLFLKRWEAPLPVSRSCNATCLGCLSLQPDSSCDSSHQRISFTPSKEEIVELAVAHLNGAQEAIVSFGQGCEGEPLTEYRLIAESIREIRKQTRKGTINLNTNGSWPERIRLIAESGLDSIRISLNSAIPDLYRAYYRPKQYDFDDVVASISLSRQMGIYTMINYLVFPGITDNKSEMEAFIDLVRRTGVNFVHMKNLCIDPHLYLEKMPDLVSPAVGMNKMIFMLKEELPDLELGYFNQPVR